LHGANRLGGNSLSDLLVFGRRAGAYAAAYAREHPAAAIGDAEVTVAAQDALAPFDRAGGESPFQVQHALQELMQDKVGIVRREDELREALDGIAGLRERAAMVGVPGNREYNPGWHTALDLGNLLDISEAITRAALDRRESRGGHFRDDYPEKDAAAAGYNTVIARGTDGRMVLRREPVPALTTEQSQIIKEQTT
jgi:succinate dehydrogenase / fumarate reductase flavoprotein subunit